MSQSLDKYTCKTIMDSVLQKPLWVGWGVGGSRRAGYELNPGQLNFWFEFVQAYKV